VDVNVHPTKSEVRFADDRGMHDLVYRKIKESLASSQIIPDFKVTERRAMYSYDAGSVKTVTQEKDGPIPKMPQPSILPLSNSISKSEEELPQGNFLSDTKDKLSPGLNLDSVVEKKEDKDTTEVKTSAIEAANFWQLADTYILSRIRGNLMVLDQHAAHERILYEEALRNFDKKNTCSQQVLFPQVQELSPKEFQILEEHRELIQKLGFEIKNFGGRTILVTAVPAFIRNKSGEVFLREILTQLEEERKEEKNRLKAVAKSFACHGAIKAGERLTQEEMQNLVHQLFTTEEPYSCPHGRPTVIKLSLEELNKKFGRS
jgi:DNA mismatch repair protein MutL